MPTIIPFTFGEEELNFDESVTATCSISKGDLPIKIWWRFNEDGDDTGLNLTTNDGILVTRNTQKVSMLAIDALKARHRGNYTCYASNKGGVAKHSAYLAINGLEGFLIRNVPKQNLSRRNLQFVSCFFKLIIS